MSEWTLKKHPDFGGVEGPVVVVVMDGVGEGRGDEGDAVALANTPTLDRLRSSCPTSSLRAHGRAVGLPSDKDMGNSEVGHNALGAGRVFSQGSTLVQEAIASGTIFGGESWKRACGRVRASGEALHFMGLLSDGNVHSHIDHLLAMLRQCASEDIPKVRVHILLDGRDVPAISALTYVESLEQTLATINQSSDKDYRIASGGGRMTTTMDRYEADWSMVERGWKHHVLGEGRGFSSATVAIQTLRDEHPGIGDQFLPAFVVHGSDGSPVGPIENGSAVLFTNFRGDRALEITRAFEEADFQAFDRQRHPEVFYAGMMQYDGDLRLPTNFLVSPPAIDRTVGEFLSRNRLGQLALSETQKYGHVTYFWNGNRSEPFDDKLERYVEIPSDNLPFEQRPVMKAKEITDTLIDELRSGAHRLLRINYANGDMVGHTGDRDATVLAVESVDQCLARLLPVITQLRGAAIITADHGNADEMIERDKKSGAFKRNEAGLFTPKTSHTLNRVPCHIVAAQHSFTVNKALREPGLANVAATALHLLGFQAPDGYEPSILQSPT